MGSAFWLVARSAEFTISIAINSGNSMHEVLQTRRGRWESEFESQGSAVASLPYAYPGQKVDPKAERFAFLSI